MTSVITDAMRGLIGRSMERLVSYPVSASDIRRWALAVYYPDDPPAQFWDERSDEAAAAGGLTAPEEFNPFAWTVAERHGPEPAVAPVAADPAVVGNGAREHLLGVPPPPLSHALNGGVDVTYGPAPMRPGDVITGTAAISDYREREGRLGLMLFTTIDNVWVNQEGAHVKTARLTLIRY